MSPQLTGDTVGGSEIQGRGGFGVSVPFRRRQKPCCERRPAGQDRRAKGCSCSSVGQTVAVGRSLEWAEDIWPQRMFSLLLGHFQRDNQSWCWSPFAVQLHCSWDPVRVVIAVKYFSPSKTCATTNLSFQGTESEKKGWGEKIHVTIFDRSCNSALKNLIFHQMNFECGKNTNQRNSPAKTHLYPPSKLILP